MLYNLLAPLADVFGPFNLFRYLTFRSIGAFLTALVLSFLIGAVGFWDDFLKVTKRNSRGVRGRTKLLVSVVVAAFGAYLISLSSPPQLRLMLALPFFKDALVPLGMVGVIAFAVLVIVGASNAVNLTDGLDG